MKKSEMIENLYTNISNIQCMDSDLGEWFNHELIQEITKVALETVENAEMLPPMATHKDPVWEKYKDTPHEEVPMFVIAGDPFYKARQWEDED